MNNKGKARMMKKKCSRCKRFLPLDKFNRNRANKDGFQYLCRECTIVYHKQYRDMMAKKRKPKKPPFSGSASRTGAMDGWTEWHELPPEVIAAMGEKENKEYCEWWCKAHPVDFSKIAERFLVALQNIRDEYEHEDAEYIK